MREKIVELLKNTKERIIGQDKYANSAVLIAIAEFNKKEYIILEKRAVEIRQGGEISLPGGRCDEKDKNSKETAIRETIEELGIPKEKIEVAGKLGILVNPSGMILEVYIGFVDLENREDIKYNRDEVERVILAPLLVLQLFLYLKSFHYLHIFSQHFYKIQYNLCCHSPDYISMKIIKIYFSWTSLPRSMISFWQSKLY